jgi:hypothetical protein
MGVCDPRLPVHQLVSGAVGRLQRSHCIGCHHLHGLHCADGMRGPDSLLPTVIDQSLSIISVPSRVQALLQMSYAYITSENGIQASHDAHAFTQWTGQQPPPLSRQPSPQCHPEL